MTRSTYLYYEVLRNFRNWRFFFLALAFPLVLYFTVAGANRHTVFDGTAFPLYFMVAMATLGTMAGVVSGAAIIAAERSSGWTRQMRITPLGTGAYFGAKVLNAYLRALLTIALMCLAGTLLGVRLSVGEWLTVIGLLLVGLVPFTVLGVLLGHLVGPDASAPAVGGIVTLFCPAGRGVRVPDREIGRGVRGHQGAPLVLAGAGGEDRARRRQLAGRGMDRDRRLDRRPHPGRGARVPAGHQRDLSTRQARTRCQELEISDETRRPYRDR